MEDYEKKYKQALGWMQSLYNGLHGKTKEEAEHFFPELKESEDERVRKELIEFIDINTISTDERHDRWLAWLEKQASQNLANSAKMNKNEQKSVDKNQTKFKDGDVLVSGQMIILFKKFEEDTDYNFVIAYAGIDISGKIQITNEHWHISNETKPATKEQRDLLFKKMKEAGYEWDDENKELKRVEQKSGWSEEDEKILKRIDSLLYSQCTIHGSEYESIHNWLKSLKDRLKGE